MYVVGFLGDDGFLGRTFVLYETSVRDIERAVEQILDDQSLSARKIAERLAHSCSFKVDNGHLFCGSLEDV